jgi:hypothetical protein
MSLNYHGDKSRPAMFTFPTAASPRSTSFTLLLGFAAFVSAIVGSELYLECSRCSRLFVGNLVILVVVAGI